MITIGHDSEFGLRRNGHIVSALDNLKEFETRAGRGFPDNMNAEIAINPVDNLKDFHDNTEELLNVIRGEGFELVMEPTVYYPPKWLKNPDALISGCDPDYSAYTHLENKAPDFKDRDSLRSCGAHVHAGVPGLDPYEFAMWMDLHVTTPLLLVEKKSLRRQLYGKAGCLRVKEYGAEYRTLSNIWLADPTRREFVWEGTHRAIAASKRGSLRAIHKWTDIPKAIDQHDTLLASYTIDRLASKYGVKRL